MIFSCKNCVDRSRGCHSKCEKYLAEKEEYEKRKNYDANDRDYHRYQLNKPRCRTERKERNHSINEFIKK